MPSYRDVRFLAAADVSTRISLALSARPDQVAVPVRDRECDRPDPVTVRPTAPPVGTTAHPNQVERRWITPPFGRIWLDEPYTLAMAPTAAVGGPSVFETAAFDRSATPPAESS